jgi:hypothetical protein
MFQVCSMARTSNLHVSGSAPPGMKLVRSGELFWRNDELPGGNRTALKGRRKCFTRRMEQLHSKREYRNTPKKRWNCSEGRAESLQSRVRHICFKNLFASKHIEANLDLISLIFDCFIFFTYFIYSLHLLIFAYKISLQFASKHSLWIE